MPLLQARAIRTRNELLAAAREVLIDRGLAGAPTMAVAKRADVSVGSLFRHFPLKNDLLVAVTEMILADLVTGFSAELWRIGPDPNDPLPAACAALWRVFRRPDMRVVLEIYVAARTDTALAEQLAPILQRHQARILDEARMLFPNAAAANEELDDAVLAIVYAMQGAAVGLFAPDPDTEIAHLAFLERLARRELSRLPGGPVTAGGHTPYRALAAERSAAAAPAASLRANHGAARTNAPDPASPTGKTAGRTKPPKVAATGKPAATTKRPATATRAEAATRTRAKPAGRATARTAAALRGQGRPG